MSTHVLTQHLHTHDITMMTNVTSLTVHGTKVSRLAMGQIKQPLPQFISTLR